MSPTLFWPYTQTTSSTYIASKKGIILQIYPHCLIQFHSLGYSLYPYPIGSYTSFTLKEVYWSYLESQSQHIEKWRIQLIYHQSQLQMAFREVNTSMHSRRIRDCTWVSVAQSILPNRWKFDRLHTEGRIFTYRITYTGRPQNSWTSQSSTSTTAERVLPSIGLDPLASR